MGAENSDWIKTGHEVPVFSFFALLYLTRNIYCILRVHSGDIVDEIEHFEDLNLGKLSKRLPAGCRDGMGSGWDTG